MTICEKLDIFFEEIRLKSTEDFDYSIKEITKKLNKKYYDNASNEEHCYMVGSIGRNTAIKDVSDVDLIFDLPKEVYERFNTYEARKQGSLLQEVKNVIFERYPNTDISADGQVVVISFDKYTIELVPAFLQEDNSFKYPDTNDGGSWKITKPFEEQDESIKINNNFNELFVKLSNMLRCWKDNIGFKFGGLLIDTLVYNFLNENEEYKNYSKEDYNNIIKEQFRFLKNQNESQSYWLALGSNQQVNNTDNGKFVKKAKKAFNKIDNCTNDTDLEDIYIMLFGKKYSNSTAKNKLHEDFSLSLKYKNVNDNEEFIEDKYPVDIKYNITVDCDVIQDGFNIKPLRLFSYLKPNKKLRFYVSKCDVPEPYNILWKVKNCGEEAYKRNDLRGQIFASKYKNVHIEHTRFRGNHYTECYIIKNNICVARKKIMVNIEEL